MQLTWQQGFGDSSSSLCKSIQLTQRQTNPQITALCYYSLPILIISVNKTRNYGSSLSSRLTDLWLRASNKPWCSSPRSAAAFRHQQNARTERCAPNRPEPHSAAGPSGEAAAAQRDVPRGLLGKAFTTFYCKPRTVSNPRRVGTPP